MNRVLILGVSGSGKSTLARELSARLDLPFVSSDDFWWEAGWEPVSEDVVRELVLGVVEGDCWVLESNFDFMRDELWPIADAVVWLDLSRWRVLLRVVRRNVSWTLRGVELWSGNRMGWWRAWLGVLHAMRSFTSKRRLYPGWLEEFSPNYVRLRSPREVRRWLDEIGRRSNES